MIYAYMRVSTQDKQEFTRQEFALKDYKIDKIYEEKISGTKKASARPEFEKLLNEVKANDTIYFESMSRMARSVQDLIETTDLLANKKKVNVVFVKENLRIGGNGLDAMGALVFNIMSAFAQFERDMIADRTSQALQAKKARGEKVGRYECLPTETKQKIKELRAKKWSYEAIGGYLGIAKSTAYKVIKEEGLNND